MKKIIFIFCIFVYSSFGNPFRIYNVSDTLYAWAKNGLNLRKRPTEDSEILSRLNYGAEVSVLYQEEVIPYNYTFIKAQKRPYENAILPPVILYGYWIKIRSGNAEGYVFSGLLLKYKPYIEKNENSEIYYTNYMQDVFELKLVEEEFIEVSDYVKEVYGDTDYYKRLFQSQDVTSEMELSTEGDNRISIVNMNFQEAIVFFSKVIPPISDNLINNYIIDKELSYNIPIGHPKSGVTILKKGNRLEIQWVFVPWD